MDDLDRREIQLRFRRMAIDIQLAHIKMIRATRATAKAFKRLAVAQAASNIEDSDLKEFDNRAHDWMRR